MRKLLSGVIAASLIAYVLLYAAIEFAKAFGLIAPPGYNADPRTGDIISVAADSAAGRAGMRAGDRIDFSEGGWLLHLSVDRTYLFAGHPSALPVLRNGQPRTIVLSVPHASPPRDAWVNVVNIVLLLFYSGIGSALYFMRRNTATLVFLALACGEAIQVDNLDPMKIASPGWMPFAMLLASLGPAIGQYGLLYFGILFSNQAAWAPVIRRYVLLPLIVMLSALYYYHFFAYTVAPAPFDTYLVASILNWLVFAAAAVAITTRVGREADSRRLRWVAVGIWAQALVFAIFYVNQNLTARALNEYGLVDFLFAWFQPAPFCIGYVLMRTRIIDARVVGARTLVYGLLTAIPIGLFSIADWIFSRKLADARLATFAEFGLAVLFGIWLNTLHKRIDRFVERIVFASRHFAFQRLRHAIHALSSVERSETATEMLCAEAAGALQLASAAVFMEHGGVYERVAQVGWDGCADAMDPDDPMVLFARSQHHSVRLAQVAPSRSILPKGDAMPEIAIPIMQHHQVIGVAFYGKHRSGEHLDGDEENLLGELSQAAAAALQRLQSIERVRELEMALGLNQHAAASTT